MSDFSSKGGKDEADLESLNKRRKESLVAELAALKKLRQNEEGKEIPIQMKAIFSICLIAIVCGAVYAFVPADDEPTFLNLDLDQENLCPSLHRESPDPVDYEYLDRSHNK
ncbi:unnamed protein product [Oikopleura dioica]|uniref:Uncharacterized protein n=1 Tax=Oikopleura dioica TaxID=34765 RepID=E4Y2Q6_OIKDI|nr:unnamed protein product [Oikopleura dioica]